MVIRPNSQIYANVEIKEYPNVVVVIPDIEHKVTRDWYGTTCIGTERTELSGRNRFPKGELSRAEGVSIEPPSIVGIAKLPAVISSADEFCKRL